MCLNERKLRETTEILQILLLIVHRGNILGHEFRELVELFKSRSFGRQQPYLDLTNNQLHKDLLTKVTYGEVALFIKCIDWHRRQHDRVNPTVSDFD